MGRLLGILSRVPVPYDVLLDFRTLADRGKTAADYDCEQRTDRVGHRDGWGLAAVSEKEEVYRRGARPATEDPDYEIAARAVSRLRTPPILVVGHLRRATNRGTVAPEHAHPFRREADGRILFFAHHGAILEFRSPEGGTDSAHLLARFLRRLGTETPTKDAYTAAARGVEEEAREAHRKRFTSFTFVLVDGQRLVAHRHAPSCPPYHALHVAQGTDGVVVASEVLPTVRGKWRLMRNGELAVYESGEAASGFGSDPRARRTAARRTA
jgi:predicted glutamine amidotransferase